MLELLLFIFISLFVLSCTIALLTFINSLIDKERDKEHKKWTEKRH